MSSYIAFHRLYIFKFIHDFRHYILFSAVSILLSGCAENRLSTTEVSHVEIALEYLEKNQNKYDLTNPRSELLLVSKQVDNLNTKHIKFNQVIKNIPVWGMELIVHLDKDNTVYLVTGKVLPGLEDFHVIPKIKPASINKSLTNTQWSNWKQEDVQLVIFNHEDVNHLAYKLTVSKSFQKQYIFINAIDGKIIHLISGVNTN